MTWIIRTLNWHRRAIAAVLAGLAALALVTHFSGSAGSTDAVVVLTRDVMAGQVVAGSDVTLSAVSRDASSDAPLRAVADAVGRPAAVTMSKGTILQETLLVAGSTAPEGRSIVPITVGDEQLRTLLVPGVHLALVSAVADVPGIVTDDAVVHPLPPPQGASLLPTDRATLVLVEVSSEVAPDVAMLGQSGQLGVILRN